MCEVYYAKLTSSQSNKTHLDLQNHFIILSICLCKNGMFDPLNKLKLQN